MDPFEYFDEIRCVNLDADADRWRLMQARFTTLRLGDRARRFTALPGELPSPSNPPPGCAFHERCPRATARCRTELPPLADIAPGHQVACFHPS